MTEKTHAQNQLDREILADARRQAERIQRRAEREAEQILEKAEQAAEQQKEALIRQAKEGTEQNRRTRRARLKMEQAAILREAREETLTAVKERALQKLAERCEGPACLPLLCEFTLAAVAQMDGERFELLLTEQERRSTGEDLCEEVEKRSARQLGREIQVQLSQGTLDAAGGLRVKGSDGREVCDQTLEGRLDRLWPELRVQVARVLFADLSGEPAPPQRGEQLSGADQAEADEA